MPISAASRRAWAPSLPPSVSPPPPRQRLRRRRHRQRPLPHRPPSQSRHHGGIDTARVGDQHRAPRGEVGDNRVHGGGGGSVHRKSDASTLSLQSLPSVLVRVSPCWSWLSPPRKLHRHRHQK